MQKPRFTTRQLLMIVVLVALLLANMNNNVAVTSGDSGIRKTLMSFFCAVLICFWGFAWALSRQKTKLESGTVDQRTDQPFQYQTLIARLYGIGCVIGLLMMVYLNLAGQIDWQGFHPAAADHMRRVAMWVSIVGSIIGTIMVLICANGFVKNSRANSRDQKPL